MSMPKGYRKGNRIFIYGDIAYIVCKNGLLLVDTDEIADLARYTWWIKNGYGVTTADGKQFFIHQFLVRVRLDGEEIDHINGNPWDNRKVNLRWVTKTKNQENRYSRNKLGLRHIYKYTHCDVFKVVIQVDGRNKYYGTYDTLDKAVKIRDNVLREMGRECPYCGLSTIAKE